MTNTQPEHTLNIPVDSKAKVKKKFEKYVGESMTWGARESIWGFFEPYLKDEPPTPQVEGLTKSEEMAIQQLTGMQYSEGKKVQDVCCSMGLTKKEWERIKPHCEWLSEYSVAEIEEYLAQLTKGDK